MIQKTLILIKSDDILVPEILKAKLIAHSGKNPLLSPWLIIPQSFSGENSMVSEAVWGNLSYQKHKTKQKHPVM